MNITLTGIITVVLLLIVIKFFSKFMSKLFGIVVIVGGALVFMYYKSWGPFEKNVAGIEHLEAKYCSDKGDEDICSCIIERAKEDMNKRFSSEEIQALDTQKIKAAYILQQSLKATKIEAIACLAMKGEEGKYTVFLQDFVPVDNKYLDAVGQKVKDLGQKISDEVENFNTERKEIEDKY